MTASEATCLFESVWNETCNDGIFDRQRWKQHSYLVAEGAACIAERMADLDTEKAFALGLMHDIGKAFDWRGKKHALEGYNFLYSRGYIEAAYAALTHDFPVKEFELHRQETLLDAVELEYVIAALESYDYTIYDRIVQVCDVVSMPHGYVLMEKRMLAAILRYGGMSASLQQIIEASYANMRYLEKQLGTSVYAALPDVAENTFAPYT